MPIPTHHQRQKLEVMRNNSNANKTNTIKMKRIEDSRGIDARGLRVLAFQHLSERSVSPTVFCVRQLR